MKLHEPVSVRAFRAIQFVDSELLNQLSEAELVPLLPCLVRMSLCAPQDKSEDWVNEKRVILKLLNGLEVVNALVGLLSIDFHELDQDARKEQQLRQKIGGNKSESILASSLQHGLALEFERSEPSRRMRLLLSELLLVMSQMKEHHTEFYIKHSELFDNEVYLNDVSDVLCIMQAELPALLPLPDLSEALLHVSNGPWLLCRLVANAAESFDEVCESLVASGEKQDEESPGGAVRGKALRMLGKMNPAGALNIRAWTIEHCRLPGLAVALTLDHYKMAALEDDIDGGNHGDCSSDLVAFISGLLLGNDVNVRVWFAQYIRGAQKKRRDGSCALTSLREELTLELLNVTPPADGVLPHRHVVQASCLLRLYCALRGIAALKLSEEETKLLVQLVTSRPPPTSAGVRFLSLGLCMLIACPILITNPEEERRVVQWIRWFLAESASFERASGVDASFGELLLLLAIHFHGNQTNAIIDLVCSTLGMKIAVRISAMGRIKAVFTQEIFTEQVVTSHAVRVPVTPDLNATMTGYLPVHCIHQLLKSRAFTKHKVPIKDWICRQIREASTPLHPLLPPLLQSYVTSVIVPPAKGDYKQTNEAISEREVLDAFRCSALMQHDDDDDDDAVVTATVERTSSGATAQLLMLYYLLLYEDCRLANTRALLAAGRRGAPPYPPQLFVQLPMKHLIQRAQRQQQLYAGLFAPLLRLLATHYPHLCQVQDWMSEDIEMSQLEVQMAPPSLPCTVAAVKAALDEAARRPARAVILLEQLAARPASRLLPYADCIVGAMARLLGGAAPRRTLELLRRLWVKLNTVIPLKLSVMTVNALRRRGAGGGDGGVAGEATPAVEYVQSDVVVDPLIVLRCDPRAFRCPPVLEIVLRLLTSFLAASRAYLCTHIQSHPVPEKAGAGAGDVEREELKNALLAAQESAAVQMLLEICLPNADERSDDSLLSDLQEVRCIVCSYLHQTFIADPFLAKLVHFQGYRSELLPVTVAGIPSMHICLDFIPELLSQPQLEKQIFAVELTSHLCLQYALPKSLSVARLAVNVLSTLLTMLSSDVYADVYIPVMPAMVRFCRAFPPLCDDVVAFLTQLAQMTSAHVAINNSHSPVTIDELWMSDSDTESPRGLPKDSLLCHAVHKAFTDIVRSSKSLALS
ncbi:PREDICTED: integrator complex subunit 2-like [Priapulus caudatus]|uniref:Integrator complex subunit 2-like n=1 Tax=Priapulus caudatus TaxID=37621 RepID=A0ABM1EVJ2_PRICU|nr:PREDICTED: integrator complex subunit 2-like [Priapulus caudatus]